MLKDWMEKSLYAHTLDENGEDTVAKGSSGSGVFRNRDVHKVMRSPRRSSRCLGVNPRFFIHLRGLRAVAWKKIRISNRSSYRAEQFIPKSCLFFG